MSCWFNVACWSRTHPYSSPTGIGHHSASVVALAQQDILRVRVPQSSLYLMLAVVSMVKLVVELALKLAVRLAVVSVVTLTDRGWLSFSWARRLRSRAGTEGVCYWLSEEMDCSRRFDPSFGPCLLRRTPILEVCLHNQGILHPSGRIFGNEAGCRHT